jgi:hypothetical protein
VELVICLNKDDINTMLMGDAVVIKANGVTVSFSREAADEFHNDLTRIKNGELKDYDPRLNQNSSPV